MRIKISTLLSDLFSSSKASRSRLSRIRRAAFQTQAAVESLEDRELLSAANPFVVNTPWDYPDANPGDGVAEDAYGNTSLRAAVMESNALAGHNTIILPARTHYLWLYGNGDEGGDLDITDDVTITGAGASSTAIQAWRDDRIFEIHSGATAHIGDLTV